MATPEPLTRPWLEEFRARVGPLLTPIQRLPSEAIWAWFNELWEVEQVDLVRLGDLRAEVLPLLDQIETSRGSQRDDSIVELVDLLRSIDTSVFYPR